MDDMAERLSELLNSPEGMEQIKTLAGALLGGGEEGKNEPEPQPEMSMPDISALMKIGGLLKQTGQDERVNLLLALKPHLSERRRERVDRAVKLLKLYSLIPVLSESGLMEGLLK